MQLGPRIQRLADASMALTIDHNEHRNVYQDVLEYLRDRLDAEGGSIDEIPAQELDLIRRNDSLWEITWWPRTPVSSYKARAASLENAVTLAEAIMREDGTLT